MKYPKNPFAKANTIFFISLTMRKNNNNAAKQISAERNEKEGISDKYRLLLIPTKLFIKRRLTTDNPEKIGRKYGQIEQNSFPIF